MLNCPYDGVFKKMYFQSKTLKLLTLQFSQRTENPTVFPKINLRKDDVEKLYFARDILQNLLTSFHFLWL